MKSEIHIDLTPCNIQFKQMSHSGEGHGGGSRGRKGTGGYDLVNIIRSIKTRRLEGRVPIAATAVALNVLILITKQLVKG